jgi:hypothetical protein
LWHRRPPRLQRLRDRGERYALQKNHNLTAPQAEAILENSPVPLPAGSRTVTEVDGSTVTYTWGTDATGHGLVTACGALALTP